MSNLSFADLERATGESYVRPKGDMWPLEKWYEKVRRKPISKLKAVDLATALRQQTWIQHVVPAALRVLQGNPQAGALYDGELVVAFKSVPREYWIANPAQAEDVKKIVQQTLVHFDKDVQLDARELLDRLE